MFPSGLVVTPLTCSKRDLVTLRSGGVERVRLREIAESVTSVTSARPDSAPARHAPSAQLPAPSASRRCEPAPTKHDNITPYFAQIYVNKCLDYSIK